MLLLQRHLNLMQNINNGLKKVNDKLSDQELIGQG